VARSVTTAADSQVPTSANSASRSALVVSNDRFPTKTFLPTVPSFASYFTVAVAVFRGNVGREWFAIRNVARLTETTSWQLGHCGSIRLPVTPSR
jgi:hypothetical protein